MTSAAVKLLVHSALLGLFATEYYMTPSCSEPLAYLHTLLGIAEARAVSWHWQMLVRTPPSSTRVLSPRAAPNRLELDRLIP